MGNPKATGVQLALQVGTDNTMVATWAFDTSKNSNTDHYEVKWQYTTGNTRTVYKNVYSSTVTGITKGKTQTAVFGEKIPEQQIIWFVGEDSTVKVKQSTYSVPSNALRVRFRVLPVSKTKKEGKTEKHYWTGAWSAWKYITFNEKARQIPSVPSDPTITISGTKLTVSVDNYEGPYTSKNNAKMQFQIIKNDSKLIKDVTVGFTRRRAATTLTIDIGGRYKARARGTNIYGNSAWSNYCENAGTIPGAVSKITSLSAQSGDSVMVKWSAATAATGYIIEYTDDKSKFDISDDVQSVTTDTTGTTRLISGLAGGTTWWFRVRGTNDVGDGGWSGKKSVKVGTAPSAPTTWSYLSVATPDEALTMNWSHNSEDGSEQRHAQVSITTTRGSTTSAATVYTVNTATYISANTTQKPAPSAPLLDGDIVKWKVKTQGAIDDYSPWSTERSIKICAQPSVSLTLTPATHDEEDPSIFSSYPIAIDMVAEPATQTAIMFSLSITSNDTYDTVSTDGSSQHVVTGDVIFSNVYQGTGDSNTMNVVLTPGDVHFETGMHYTANVVVGMSSGLQALDSTDFSVAFEEDEFDLRAEVGIDRNKLTATVRPFCVEPEYESELTEGAVLGVYRREFDGTFTALETDISMASGATVSDPHPALDYARYRITATSTSTGRITFFDTTGLPILEPAVIIQWDEQWTYFDANGEDEMDQPAWTGSMLRLPYNINVSDKFSPDVSLVEYIGREHPVSYYGTQKGHTADWTVDIPKNDEETLYAIRRLARYSGDVYVREPSGTGYWAQVNVSYDIDHDSPLCNVSFEITRVEGGA